MADTNLQLDSNGSGTLDLMGNPMDVTFKDGKITAFGQELYTYEMPDDDTIIFNMQGPIYTFLREGSEAAEAIKSGGYGYEIADAVSAAINHEYSDDADITYYPSSRETEYKFDGGTLYYENWNGKAVVTWVTPTTKDLYIPEEVDGLEVMEAQKVGGHVENLYLPYGVTSISHEIGPVKGVKTLTIGYGDKDNKFEYFSHGLKYGEDLEKIVFNKSIKDIGWTASVFQSGDSYPKLKEVVNPPGKWKEGIEYHTKFLAILEKSDPSSFISKPSEKVTKLAKEVTKGAKTDEEKLYAISEWIVNNIQYDLSYAYHEYSRDYLPDIDPDDIIESRTCVCSGYSHLTKAMCNAVGIPAVYIVGDTPTVKHAWNAVYIDGEWAFYDNTENDKDYNADPDLYRDMEEVFDKSLEITYEDYMANEELKEAYTWEELEEILENGDKQDNLMFDEYHPYYNLNPVQMGSHQIPEKYEGIKFQDGTSLK